VAREQGVGWYSRALLPYAESAPDRESQLARASELLEVLQHPDCPDEFRYEFGRIARVLVSCGRVDELDAVVESCSPGPLLRDLSVLTGRATVAEAQEAHRTSLELYREAEAGWADYGYRIEQAHALLGIARCSSALAEPGRQYVMRAEEIAKDVGAHPLLDTIRELLTTTPT
jgi:hypothetical protein